ncbi:phosphopantetheine attachment site family protein, partial [Vibrio parahaemolyticus VPTS-2010_2]
SNTREHFASVANLAKYVSSQTNE